MLLLHFFCVDGFTISMLCGYVPLEFFFLSLYAFVSLVGYMFWSLDPPLGQSLSDDINVNQSVTLTF